MLHLLTSEVDYTSDSCSHVNPMTDHETDPHRPDNPLHTIVKCDHV